MQNTCYKCLSTHFSSQHNSITASKRHSQESATGCSSKKRTKNKNIVEIKWKGILNYFIILLFRYLDRLFHDRPWYTPGFANFTCSDQRNRFLKFCESMELCSSRLVASMKTSARCAMFEKNIDTYQNVDKCKILS